MVSTLIHATGQPIKKAEKANDFSYISEQFADLRILRYQIPGFANLTLQQKKLAYYLSQAALAGRDIYWDQNYKHNLTIRRLLEQIMLNFKGSRNNDTWEKFTVYAKRVWFSNGIHHHYGNDKFIPTFTEAEFRDLIAKSPSGNWPLSDGENLAALIDRIIPIIFDYNINNKKVCLEPDVDKVVCSAWSNIIET
jgi:dipeptidyl-peptidase III